MRGACCRALTGTHGLAGLAHPWSIAPARPAIASPAWVPPSSILTVRSRPRDGAGLLGFRWCGYPADAHAASALQEARPVPPTSGSAGQADRLRALLFAEPQVLISWAAATTVRKSARHFASESRMPGSIRRSASLLDLAAAGAGAADGSRKSTRCARPARVSCLISPHPMDTRSRPWPRHRRKHCADSRTQWIRPGLAERTSGTRRAGRNRDAARFVAQRLADVGQRAKGGLCYANAAYARATDAVSAADAIDAQP